MELKGLELHLLEWEWDEHTVDCPVCRTYLFQQLDDTVRIGMCRIGKKFYDQWFAIFDYVE